MPTYTAILHTLYKGGVTGDGGSESHGSHPSPVVTAVMELVKSVLYAGDDTSCAALLADGSPLSCRCGPAVVAESLARLHARGQGLCVDCPASRTADRSLQGEPAGLSLYHSLGNSVGKLPRYPCAISRVQGSPWQGIVPNVRRTVKAFCNTIQYNTAPWQRMLAVLVKYGQSVMLTE